MKNATVIPNTEYKRYFHVSLYYKIAVFEVAIYRFQRGRNRFAFPSLCKIICWHRAGRKICGEIRLMNIGNEAVKNLVSIEVRLF